MTSRLGLLVDLLHSHGDASLATHSGTMPGYPLATQVSFAPDQHHRPLLLISKLAEHTRNLAADPRASFLVARVTEGGEIARASLVGEVLPIDADERTVERYLRFHPEAERFRQLGDFHFYRFEPRRVLVVGGFARAAWIEGEQLLDAPSIPLEIEGRLLDEARSVIPPGQALLGIDAYGIDLAQNGARRRITFSVGPVVAEALPATLTRELASA